MTSSLRLLLQYEEAELFRLIELLSPPDEDKLRQRIDDVSAHQTSLPEPPANLVMRKFAEVGENISLSWNDRSTVWHPGIEHVMNEPR